jgi:hypothetical protein
MMIFRNCKNTGKSMWTCTSWTKIILHLSLHLDFDYDFVLIWCWGGSSQSVGLKTTGFDSIRYCTRSETLCSNRQTMYPYVGTSSGGKFAWSLGRLCTHLAAWLSSVLLI